jgi:hypothetical protein
VITSPNAFSCPSTEPDETRAELAARFIRDAVPMHDHLYSRAANLTGNRFDAEDLLQETMLRAYATFSSFRPETNQPQGMDASENDQRVDIQVPRQSAATP